LKKKKKDDIDAGEEASKNEETAVLYGSPGYSMCPLDITDGGRMGWRGSDRIDGVTADGVQKEDYTSKSIAYTLITDKGRLRGCLQPWGWGCPAKVGHTVSKEGLPRVAVTYGGGPD